MRAAVTPRCDADPACPVRFRSGPDRRCRAHALDDDDVRGRTETMLGLMSAPRSDDGQVVTVSTARSDDAQR